LIVQSRCLFVCLFAYYLYCFSFYLVKCVTFGTRFLANEVIHKKKKLTQARHTARGAGMPRGLNKQQKL